LGGSIGLALRERRLAERVIGIGRNASRLEKARGLGAVDEGTTDLSSGVADADLVVICTPVEEISRIGRSVVTNSSPGALITDVGSTKEQIVREFSKITSTRRQGPSFVGSHPIAGSEKAGVEAARPNLFQDRVCVITPTKKVDRGHVTRLSSFWTGLGARVIEMTPKAHDSALASTSHLPHLIASALAVSTSKGLLDLVGGGWLDSTRIAAGEPELWQQILNGNAAHVLNSLANFEKVLNKFRKAIQNRDATTLRKLLQAGKDHRDIVGN